jgi:hypothetical protein
MKASRIDRIRAALKKRGPMTVIQISEATRISPSNVAGFISAFRDNPGQKKGIRKSGKAPGDFGTFRYIFELSDEPDDEDCTRRAPSKDEPKLSREEMQERRYLRELAKRIQPFRHWQDVAFFGEAP